MELRPKELFAGGPMAKPWTDVVGSSLFQEAAKASLLQLQANMGTALYSDEAARNHFRMEGARQFLWMMMNLTAPPVTPPAKPIDNLDHSV